VSRHGIDEGTYPSLAALVRDVGEELKHYGSIARLPPDRVAEVRNDMHLASESVRLLMRDRASDLSADDVAKLRDYPRDEVHPALGQGRRRDRARRRHDDWLETLSGGLYWLLSHVV